MCASACAATVALALAGPGWAASAPTPDDPPAGPRSEASPTIATAPTATPPATGGSSSGAPRPDAPTVAVATPHAAPDPGTTAPRTAPAQTQTQTQPVATAPAVSHRPTGGTASSGRTAKPKAAAHASRPARHHRAATKTEPRNAGTPRDGSRVGLPFGTAALAAVTHDSGRAALLAAAALLLVAAGGGGLVIGIVGRRLAGPA